VKEIGFDLKDFINELFSDNLYEKINKKIFILKSEVIIYILVIFFEKETIELRSNWMENTV